MAGGQSSGNVLTTNMNMAITIFGFVLSALFITVICCRLLCSRFRNGNSMQGRGAGIESALVGRSLNGLDPSTVLSFPTIKYCKDIFLSSEDNMCSICLNDYKEKEVLRILPRCGHGFHLSCIDVWLRHHSTCPVCRISLLVFSNWMQIPGPLISLSAKARFVPGAIPDSMFEEPGGVGEMKLELQHAKVNSEQLIDVGEGDVRAPEMAESSSSRHYEDEQLLSPKLRVLEHPEIVREPRLTSESSRKSLLTKAVIDDDDDDDEEGYPYLGGEKGILACDVPSPEGLGKRSLPVLKHSQIATEANLTFEGNREFLVSRTAMDEDEKRSYLPSGGEAEIAACHVLSPESLGRRS